MNQDIIAMAREAGAGHTFRYSGNNTRRSVYRFHNTELERFAALVAAAEREACAKVCDGAVAALLKEESNKDLIELAVGLRDAIRARSDK